MFRKRQSSRADANIHCSTDGGGHNILLSPQQYRQQQQQKLNYGDTVDDVSRLKLGGNNKQRRPQNCWTKADLHLYYVRCRSKISTGVLLVAIILILGVSSWIYCCNSSLSLITSPRDGVYNESITLSTQFGKREDKLEFLHIPKTGGSSLEFEAANSAIAWGACKFIRNKICSPLANENAPPIEDETEWSCAIGDNRKEETKVLPWHCPLNYFQNGKNIYNGSKTFTIVRDPYDRMVSEYYYFRPSQGFKLNNPQQMNIWISEQLDKVEKIGVCEDGHCIPMHRYTHSGATQIVDHILHLENITAELPDVLNQYHLGGIKMGHRKMRNKSDKLNASHLTNETICKINQWANLDFEYFGYRKRTNGICLK